MSRRALPLPLESSIGESPPEDAEELFAAVTAARSRRRRAKAKRRAWMGSGAALACAAAAAVAWMTGFQGTGPGSAALGLAGDTAFPPTVRTTGTHRALKLSDGSWVTLAARTRLDLLESSRRVFSVALRHGRARFDLRPQEPRSFRVECGRVMAEVVGTAFVVERRGEDVSLTVLHGAVLVRGEGVPDRVQRLGAGQHFAVAHHDGPADAPPAGAMTNQRTAGATQRDAPVPARPAGRMPRSVPSANAPAQEVTPAAPERWRLAAGRGQWSEAFEALEREGMALAVRRARTVDELLQLADIARLSGHPREALAPLKRAVERYGDSPQAALAAFTRGKIQVDSLGAPGRGASDIALAVRLGLPRALAEDARARLVEAYSRAGQAQLARQAAAEYRAQYPRGARMADVDRWSPR